LKSGKFLGTFSGLLRGTIGLPLKSASGVLDFGSKTFEGI